MALSDSALRVLADTHQHPLRTVGACNNVLRSLLKSGYVEEGPVSWA